MPTIFALLPLTTNKPLSSFFSFIMYPFTYPKTEKAAQKLPEIMKNYYNLLVESFNNFDAVKSLPTFAKDLDQIQKGLARMHSISAPSQPTVPNTEAPSKTPVSIPNSKTSAETTNIAPKEATTNVGKPLTSIPEETNNNIAKENENNVK
jgi:hypothetical protein